jgi:hypothetical protein
MKKTILIFVAIVIMAGFTSKIMAQVSATATATAVIITPIAIVNAGNMNFGNVAVSTALGTVVLTPASVRSKTGGVTLPATTGTVAAAAFTVTGLGTSTYAITLPTTDYTITDGASHNMIVNTFTSTPSGTGALVGGTQTLLVGATLNVTGSQVAGTYTNATGFTVTVNYN